MDLASVIASVLSPDNATRRAAEHAFNQVKAEHPEVLAMQLMRLLSTSDNELVRAAPRACVRTASTRAASAAPLMPTLSPAHTRPAHASCAGAHVLRRARAQAGGRALFPAGLGVPRCDQGRAPALRRVRAARRRAAQGVRRRRPARLRDPRRRGVARARRRPPAARRRHGLGARGAAQPPLHPDGRRGPRHPARARGRRAVGGRARALGAHAGAPRRARPHGAAGRAAGGGAAGGDPSPGGSPARHDRRRLARTQGGRAAARVRHAPARARAGDDGHRRRAAHRRRT